MKHIKATSVLLSAAMCMSIMMTPAAVLADETPAPSEEQKTEETEKQEPEATEPKATEPEAEKPEETAEKTKPRRKKSFSIQVTDSKKFRRLVAILAVFAVLLAFEISFAVMKARTSALPGSTAKLRSKTETLQANNKQLQESIDKLGDYDEIKAKKDSWQKTKEQLEQLK